MALIQDWYPPSRENYNLVVWAFGYFPLVTVLQWAISWYGAGKTSVISRFNIPGKAAWITMEVPGFLTLVYTMYSLPKQLGIQELPWENKVMGALFVTHYLYRAIIGPLISPSMSPIHGLVWAAAILFQVSNGLSIGSYLGGYGPTTQMDWQTHQLNSYTGKRMALGMLIWALGLAGNIYHDEELREIRRAALRDQKKRDAAAEPSTGKGKGSRAGVEKVYKLPQNGLFAYILYPHYLCEWIEWAGFWLMAGSGCIPARNFVVNEVATMLPRALSGKKWYVEKFGKEKVGNRKAVIPGIL